MFEKFNFGKTHITAEQRPRLQEAILKDDAGLFREVLRESPPPDDRFRLYGVLSMTEQGMAPILVDRTGRRFGGPGAVIPAGTPIDMLNMEFSPTEIVVTIGEDIYRAPLEANGARE